MVTDFSNIKYSLPLTYPWQLRRLIPPQSKTVIDIGCGDGYIMKWVSFGRGYDIYGIEIDSKSITRARNLDLYKDIYKQNLITGSLPKRKFDVVLCSQVVEHLPKAEGLKLIKKIERLALKRVIVATTNGFIEYDHGPSKSLFDKHRSGWEVDDFVSCGYKVLGHGLKWIYQPLGIKKSLPPFFTPLLFLISYLLTPLLIFFPKPALFLIAYKDIQ